MSEKSVCAPNGRYIYAVVPKATTQEYGPIGLDGAHVRMLSYGEISAVVHDCPLEPYDGDAGSMMRWVNSHNDVIDRAWAATGSVLPMRFGVIIRSDDAHNADENVCTWLEGEHSNFKIKLDEFKNKVELGVQILWEPAIVASALVNRNEEIRALKAEVDAMSPGTAYLQRHKIAETMKRELERKAARDYTACYEAVREHAESIHVNKLKKRDGKTMIANLALLVGKEDVDAVGAALGAFSGEEGVEIRFTGPWPPYTFAANIPAAGEGGALGPRFGDNEAISRE